MPAMMPAGIAAYVAALGATNPQKLAAIMASSGREPPPMPPPANPVPPIPDVQAAPLPPPPGVMPPQVGGGMPGMPPVASALTGPQLPLPGPMTGPAGPIAPGGGVNSAIPPGFDLSSIAPPQAGPMPGAEAFTDPLTKALSGLRAPTTQPQGSPYSPGIPPSAGMNPKLAQILSMLIGAQGQPQPAMSLGSLMKGP